MKRSVGYAGSALVMAGAHIAGWALANDEATMRKTMEITYTRK